MQSTKISFWRALLPQILLAAILFLGGHWSAKAQSSYTITSPSYSVLQTAVQNGYSPIIFAFDGTITMPAPLEITYSTVFDASGHNVTLSGGNSTWLFLIDPVNFSATNLTFAFGKAVGGNGANGTTGSSGTTGGTGTAGSSGSPGQGGAIFNTGTSAFVNCKFLTNNATGGNGGNGGAGGTGTVNTGGNGGSGGSGGVASGGAVYNAASLILSNCTFTANTVIAGNGGNGGTNGSGASGPGSPGNGGAGALASGAAVYNETNALVTIYGCTFNGQTATGGNSQLGNPPQGNGNGRNGQNGGAAEGGAVGNAGTNSTINCTFYANSVLGGNGGAGGPASFGVFGGNGGNGGSGFGGNIYNSGNLGVTNCTIASGSVHGGTGGAGGSGSTSGSTGSTGSIAGANIYNAGGTFSFKNSILDYPTNATSASGTITDRGNNISSDSTPSFSTNSFNSTDPKLGSLTTNGGPTLTMALLSGSPAIGRGDNTAAPLADQRGYYWVNYSDIGAYDTTGIAVPIVQILPYGPSASEDGDVALFMIIRSLAGGTAPITVNYTISGTATNGVNYVQLTNSLTITSGVFYVQGLVRAIPNSFSGTNLSVVLTLSTNAAYTIDPNFSSTTLALQPRSTLDSTARFIRGTTTAPDFQSFVIPLDSETGVPLAATGGNATNLFPGNPWTTNFYHYNATNLSSQTGTNGRIVFQNPIVAFGGPAGGSPLYLNQNYNFGIYAGNVLAANATNALRIQVYYRSNSAFAGSIAMSIPNVNNLSQFTGLVTNGFTQSSNAFGLQTTVLMSDFQDWGLLQGFYFNLTHNASSSATNYYYVVEQNGFGPLDYLVRNQSGNPDWSKLYVLEFAPFPAGRSTFVDQPQFNGIPMPAAYQGMSIQELTNAVPTLPSLSFLTPTNYLTIDGSPELRRHPILDSFVADMGNDPLALANYVINEIGLTDAIDYDTNYNSQAAVNLGGVDRGALGTFQEGQGSPVEQCALLVYLLRQAGVPAAYVYPTNNGLQMLDFQVSKLLHVQLHGAQNGWGQTNLPQLISVNYPWVAAYIGTNWVQIFPWLKDTEITEGLNLYDYMPSNYNSGYKWLTHFIAGDTNIFSLSASDQPLDLLPAFLQNNLDANFPGVSVDDIGVQVVNRRHLYPQWSSFPLPFSLTGTPLVVESLKTNLSLFNTLDVLVYSQAATNKYIDSTEMRVMDFHDRKLLLKFVQVGTSNVHNMVLTLSPYSTNITSQTAFSTSADPTWILSSTNQLSTNDDNIVFQMTHRRNKFLPSNYTAPLNGAYTNLWGYNYFEQGQVGTGQTYQQTNTFRKGDLIAFCLDVGRVSQPMLDVQAQEIWRYNQTATTNNANLDVYAGTTAYLLGLSYMNYLDQFADLNNRLHKIENSSSFKYGFGLIRPLRTSTGALTNNGAVIPVLPAVHMPNNGQGLVFNSALRADEGRDFFSTTLDWWLQLGVAASAAEHGVLRAYYQTNAISAVKLLQQAGTNTLALNSLNYLSYATNVYGGVQLQNADPVTWNQILNFFNTTEYDREVLITPGKLTNGTFVGVGALLLSSDEFASPVSGLNGGFADQYPSSTFSAQNSPNLSVLPAPDGATSPYVLDNAAQANNPSEPVDGETTAGSLPNAYTNLVNGSFTVDPVWTQVTPSIPMLFGYSGTTASAFQMAYLNQGLFATSVPNYMDSQQLAAEPVDIMSGEFYVDAIDLILPGPLNLQVRRNYGSQNLSENQFGFGWKINYMPFLSVGTNSTLIYAAEMDGSVVAYRQNTTNASLWQPAIQDNPALNNKSSMGIGSIANLFNNRIALSTNAGTNIYTLTGADGSVRVFAVNSFPLGGFNRQRPYLNTWQDNRGNSYTFQYGTNASQPDWGQLRRIQSSNGNFLGFYYDVYGHIIEAYTGDGRILHYDYDKFGDLITVTLPDESQINYVYQHANQVTNGVTNLYSTHLIYQELKPDGRILQNGYDSQRRVTNQLATVGSDLNPIRNATFAYTNNFSLSSPTNQLTGVTAVYDYTNNVTTYAYTNGLIQSITDPLHQTITQTWYGAATNGGYPRSLQSVTDKRGLQTTYLYDAFGNVTNATASGDLTGTGSTSNAVSSATYNTNNLPLTLTDRIGNQTQIVYSTNYPFLPQQIIQLAGASPWCTNLMAYTNAATVVTNGSVVQTNSAYGLLTRTIRAYGSPDAATDDLFFDGRGFATNSVRYTGTADPAVTNQFLYNNRGEMVQRTDAAGRVYSFTFDPMGRPVGRETFEVGQSTPMDWYYWYYNANGELTWTDGPRYNPEDYVWRDYDGAGRKIQEIHWRTQGNQNGSGVSAAPGYSLYATSFYQYDPLGDLVQATDPLGNYVAQNFDAISQLTRQVFYASNGTALATNGFAHEPGGLVSYATNALGAVTTNLYTATGKLKFRGNPDGSTHSWLYDLTGRVVRETFLNGNYWQTTYDDFNQRVTNSFFSGTTNLATKTIQRDRRGNVIQSTDASGNTSTNLFDGLDRIKVAAGPSIVTLSGTTLNPTNFVTNIVQEVITHIYDGSGKVLVLSNALGETTVTTNDPLGRPLVVSIYPSNSVTPIRMTSMYYSPDHHSMIVTNGTGTNAIVTTSYTDVEGHPVLILRSPTNGVTEYVWQQFDAAGNRIARQQFSSSSGSTSTWATNGWTYDGLNRVQAETSKDGAVSTFSYDALGDVTNRAVPGNLAWTATYLTDGRLASEQEQSGGTTARSKSYQYYSAGSAYPGMPFTVTDGRGTTRTNIYDAFLRLAQLNTTGSAAEQQISTAYFYDLDGRPLEISQSFASTNTGPGTSLGWSYFATGRMGFAQSTISGDEPYTATPLWDAAGRRIQFGIGILEPGVSFGGSFSFAYQADGLMTAANDSTFTYANNGLLAGRANRYRTYTVNQRDGCGRILQATTGNIVSTFLAENLAWRADGRLTNYVGVRGDFTDSRNFSYSPLAQRLTQESYNIASAQSVTNSYSTDAGATGGLGILTSQSESGTVTANWTIPPSGGLDSLSRVAQSQNSILSRSAYGLAQGAGTVSATLDGHPVSVQFDGAFGTGQWRADLDLSSGSHTLSVSAVDPSGQYSGSTNSTFTVATNALDTVANTYDGEGNITQRVWVNSLGQTNRTQSLTWDAFNRLISVIDRDTQSNGFNWTGVYDGLGRRLRTTYALVISNTPAQNLNVSNAVSVVDSLYDPQVEFLEVGVVVNGSLTLKNYGPDANGVYGGMQGVGGLESMTVSGHTGSIGTVQDFWGNVIGTITNGTITNGTVAWNPSRYSGYGPVPGYQSPALSINVPLAQSVGWRGKRVDETGFIYLGARHYDPTAGRFISADPLGHSASMDLYSYCGGDPVNLFDSDGRCNDSVWDTIKSWLNAYGQAETMRTQNTTGGSFVTGEQTADAAQRIYNNSIALGSGRFESYYESGAYLFGGFTGYTSLYEGSANFDFISGQPINDPLNRGLRIGLGAVGVAGTGFSGGAFVTSLFADSSASVTSTLGAGTGTVADMVAPISPATASQGATLFRGTSQGFAGSPALQSVGLTPASTDPLVATVFATESENYGAGVVHIASPQALSGVNIGPGNVLAGLESEVGVSLTPAEFAARAETTISASQARAILQNMGFSVPTQIANPGALNTVLQNTSRLTTEQIQQFIQAARGL